MVWIKCTIIKAISTNVIAMHTLSADPPLDAIFINKHTAIKKVTDIAVATR